MQRQFLAGVLLAGLVTGCVSQEPSRPPVRTQRYTTPAPEPVTPRSSPAPSVRPPSPVTRTPPRVARAWLPRSGRVSPRWTTIVIHHSATERGSAATFDKYHRQKGWDELGYHFVIGNGSETQDGMIEVGTRWHAQKHGAHCKTPDNYYNEHGIGICLVGDFTRQRPTRRQIDSLQRLVAFLSAECRIPPARITTHHTINPKTRCPGELFPLATFRHAMRASAAAGRTR